VRSRPDVAALVLIALLSAAPAAAAGTTPTDAEVAAAVEKVKADPNLGSEKTVTTLEWRDSKKPRKPRKERDWGWLSWLGDFFGWIAQGSRVLVWVVLAALAAWLITFIVRMLLSNASGIRGSRFVAPTHVQDLDIRPESLPPDIGAAARALWDGGEQRAALALLYRGLLSRLAHVHEVPIKDSSTEGDCLALAARKLDAARVDYATQLVRTWQRAIYGGLTIDSATVHALCAGFARHLDPPANRAAAGEPLASGAPA
jgi:hypothetical protein